MSPESIDPSLILVSIKPYIGESLISNSTFAYYDPNQKVLLDGVIYHDGTALVRTIDDVKRIEVMHQIVPLESSRSVYDHDLAREALAQAISPSLRAFRRHPDQSQDTLY